jgi:hypothetical protein
MAAIAATLDVAAESSGAASLNSGHGAPPCDRQRGAMPFTESRAEAAEHIRHFQPLAGHVRAVRRARGPAPVVSSPATRPADWQWRRPCWWRYADNLTWCSGWHVADQGCHDVPDREEDRDCHQRHNDQLPPAVGHPPSPCIGLPS